MDGQSAAWELERMAVQTVAISSPRSPRKWLWLWTAISVVAVLAVVWIVLRSRTQVPPAPTDDPTKVAKFVSTPKFLLLSFDQQRDYAYAMRKAVNDLEKARDSGALTSDQYEYARALAWMGGKLEHLKEYLDEPTPEAKKKYVDRMLVRRAQKNAANPISSADSEEARGFYESPVTRKIVATWSKRRRAQWEEFHTVTHERKAFVPSSASKPVMQSQTR